MNVTVLDSVHEANRNQWNTLVKQSDLGRLFHRYEWLVACEEGIDVEPKHVEVSKDGNPVAVFPNFMTETVETGVSVVDRWARINRIISIQPGYGGPIFTGNESKQLDLAFQALLDSFEGPVVEHVIRTGNLGYVRYDDYLTSRGYQPDIYDCRFVIDLRDGWETVRDRMDSDCRRALRRASENNPEVRLEENDPASIERLYEDYVDHMERIDVTPLSRDFFDVLASELEERLLVFSAVVDGNVVGRHVCLLDDDQSTVYNYLAAVPDKSNFEYYPSELLDEHAMKWAIENDYQWYDLGGTKPAFDHGTFRHKSRYGVDPQPSITWRKEYVWNDDSRLEKLAYNAGRDVFRRLQS